MHMNRNNSTFTLLEVIIALAILTMGIAAAMTMSSSSTRRAEKAGRIWQNQHMAAQATEFFLLAGPRAQIPSNVFDYEGYSATCRVDDSEFISQNDNFREIPGWKLVTLTIEVSDVVNGNVVETIVVDKILKEEDL